MNSNQTTQTSYRINIIGAGLAGLSAAIHLAESGQACRLISVQPSERAQSVMAEGGINAALDTMGEHDDVTAHYEDTLRGGAWLADENAVWNLTSRAPDIVRWLANLGVPFQMEGQKLILRNFGGQKKKRTAYSRSSTGKILMTALIDEARKHEASGRIRRLPHHQFVELLLAEDSSASGGSPGSPSGASSGTSRKTCTGVRVRDLYTGEVVDLPGTVILASGGLGSLFPGLTTGTQVNTGDVTATVFEQGVELANLEFIQYHPTTVPIPGKCCLITEAARGEGGRLFVRRGDEKWYFMEEKYPELGNLMPRDVVSREELLAVREADTGDQVYLDMTHIEGKVWRERLSDLREECIRLLRTDPKTSYLAVQPGIHFFMGGILVDAAHRTSFGGLYAAGECACQYHGANRLGGNSMLGALVGGQAAAASALADLAGLQSGKSPVTPGEIAPADEAFRSGNSGVPSGGPALLDDYAIDERIAVILRESLGVFRDGDQLAAADLALREIDELTLSEVDRKRLRVGRAMMLSAINRCESRGAHTRTDYPNRDDANYQKTSVVQWDGGEIHLEMRPIAKREEE